MPFRKKIERLGEKVKDKLGSLGSPARSTSSLPGAQADPGPTSAQAQSHSPTPVPGSYTEPSAKPVPTQTTKTWKCFNGFQQVLNGATTAFAPLQLAMGELGGIISVFEDAAEAQSEYAALKNELEGLFSTLSAHFSNDTPPTMTEGMKNLCAAIKLELDTISTLEERGRTTRYLEVDKDLEDVMKCYRRIQGQLERMKLNTDLKMAEMLQKQTTETLLKSLAPSLSACHNSAQSAQVGRRECTPETRKKVLEDLSRWKHDKSQGNMYWMSGMAGTGKTTIAGSFCKMLDEAHELGASFFCTRLLPECRKVELILPTIAYQLARFSHPFYLALSQALEQDPDLHTKAIPIQFEGLVTGPLRQAAKALPEHLIVVIDALDECEDGPGVSQLLETLAQNVRNLPIKVFVASRPEPQIRQQLGDSKLKLILHDLEHSIVKEDIRLYLQTELRTLSVSISNVDLSTLVERAGVLFIYAATIIRYITKATPTSRQQKRVRAILDMGPSDSSTTGSEIDSLYNAILTAAFDNPDLGEDEKRTMKFVLDTVVCTREPLTASALAGLLKLEHANSVLEALEPLWSVLHISGDELIVSTLHASFPDYLLDPKRSHTHLCDREEHNGSLATLCFDLIHGSEKQFNICGLESSYMFDEEVTDLNQRVERDIPQDLFYVCRYWSAHLTIGKPSVAHWQRVQKFIEERMLLWMEVLNLKKLMHLGSSAMQATMVWCQDQNAPQSTQDLMHDAWRFVTMFSTNDVARSTVHLYVSMLASWPSSGPLTHSYTKRVNGLSGVKGTGMARRQLAPLGVLNAGGAINSVVISPDGMRIVSGSNDKTIQVWDTYTGKLLLDPLRGHTSSVRSVAFSPDGMRIVSGSDDKTIRVWDVQTGTPRLDPLQGHTDSVLSVAFSANKMRIVSGSSDNTIRVWDAQTGRLLLKPLIGHTWSVNSVAFSPDGMRIVSGSSDSTIRVWDAQSCTLLLDPLIAHVWSVNSVAFSPDGMRIVSGSNDNTVRVWDAQTGNSLLDPLKGHTSFVNSVAYSSDGTRIISGSWDKTIQVWDAQTGKSLLNPLKGHTNWVKSVAFSPDGMRIVSGSYDSTIRVWDAQAGKSLLDPLKGHIGSVNSVAFSPNGMYIVSGSSDSTIQVWDAQTGKSLLDSLEGHTDLFNPVVFPTGGKHVVSGSNDRTIQLCEAKTGNSRLDKPDGHTMPVYSVAFSPDGIRVVSGSFDKTIRVWKTQTGNLLLDLLVGHSSSVSSVAFSPDGMRIVSGSSDSRIRVWDAHTGKSLLDPLEGHTELVRSVAFSPDGIRIVSGSWDKTVRVWHAQTGNSLLQPLKGHTDAVDSVAFSPDCTRIVSGSWDNTVRVWDAQTGNPLLSPLTGHSSQVYSVAFSPDGMRIASGSQDRTIRIWDAQTGHLLLQPLKGHTDSVNSVAFSPDGARIVSGSSDKAIRVWHLASPAQRYRSRWVLDNRGWVRGARQQPLLWVPPDLRDRLVLSNMICLISTEGSVELDFEGAKLGEAWVDCYTPCPPT